MTREEFEKLIGGEPALAGPIQRAAAALPGNRRTFGPISEAAAVAIMFPVAVYIVREIGLPWLYEGKRYLELWRNKFHRWIDGQYRKEGFDPEAAEAAGEALRRELETLTHLLQLLVMVEN